MSYSDGRRPQSRAAPTFKRLILRRPLIASPRPGIVLGAGFLRHDQLLQAVAQLLPRRTGQVSDRGEVSVVVQQKLNELERKFGDARIGGVKFWYAKETCHGTPANDVIAASERASSPSLGSGASFRLEDCRNVPDTYFGERRAIAAKDPPLIHRMVANETFSSVDDGGSEGLTVVNRRKCLIGYHAVNMTVFGPVV